MKMERERGYQATIIVMLIIIAVILVVYVADLKACNALSNTYKSGLNHSNEALEECTIIANNESLKLAYCLHLLNESETAHSKWFGYGIGVGCLSERDWDICRKAVLEVAPLINSLNRSKFE